MSYVAIIMYVLLAQWWLLSNGEGPAYNFVKFITAVLLFFCTLVLCGVVYNHTTTRGMEVRAARDKVKAVKSPNWFERYFSRACYIYIITISVYLGSLWIAGAWVYFFAVIEFSRFLALDLKKWVQAYEDDALKSDRIDINGRKPVGKL